MHLIQRRSGIFILILGLTLMLAFSACSGIPENLLTATVAVTSPLPTPSSYPSSSHQPVQFYTYRIINVFPHDTGAFTQGLVLDNGILYEGTGELGKSSLRRVDLETGRVLQIYQLPDKYFGEGITVYQDRIIQLTYQSNTGFVYDKNSFEKLDQFTYPTEGWGITSDGKRLIMSDGTSRLYFRDPVTLETTGDIEVLDNMKALEKINELEYINGRIYANIWPTSRIAIIDPQSGHVRGWIDLSGLLQTQVYSGRVDVLNGTAYNALSGHLVVTGKWWPFLFEIQLVETQQ